MDQQDLSRQLAASLQDHHLSRNERQALTTLLGDLDESEKAEARRLAFSLAEARIPDPDSKLVIGWLEQVIAVLVSAEEAGTTVPDTSEAIFSPDDDCAYRITRLIEDTTHTLDICVFTITDDRISDAIVDAHRRKVRLRIITDDDKAHDLGSDIDRFRKVGIPLRTDRTDYHMHHKFAIFDAKQILTGSYNWTRGASRDNHENIVITSDSKLVKAFTRTFEKLWKRLS